VLAPLFSQRLLLFPNGHYTFRGVLGYGTADPGKNLNEPRFASVFSVADDDVRFSKDEVLSAIYLPGLGKRRLQLGFFAGFDVICDKHGLRISFG